jgi:glucosamine kinase
MNRFYLGTDGGGSATRARLVDAAVSAILRRAAKHLGDLVEAVASRGAARIALVGGLAAPLMPWLAPSVRSRRVDAEGTALDAAIRMIRAVDG